MHNAQLNHVPAAQQQIMPAAAAQPNRVEILNPNDVLMGRGGPNKYSGNLRFRDLVEERRAEYQAIDSYKEKASDIVNLLGVLEAKQPSHFFHIHRPELPRKSILSLRDVAEDF